ncbi:WD40 repeat domain-containing protein [Sulfuricaulis sp.]|uniref:WD40 repeat domain-containing protein n=1 Tax=Sulfuricaulis sp. TaxID=2003553 RepID=UPI00355955E5
MIFPRSRRGGNAERSIRQRIGIGLLTGVLGLSGCASLPRIPANVVLRDAHNNGYTLAFDNRSETLATGGSEGRVRLWRLPDGKELSGWKAHTDSLQGLVFLDHDRELLSAAYDGTLARWTREGALLKRLNTPAPVTSMAADEAANLVVTGHSDGHVRLWRLADLSLARDLHPHRGAVRAVAYHAATDQLASSGTDGRVFYWRGSEEPRPLPAPPTDAQDLAFAPDGTFLMGSGWFNLFRWRLDNGGLQVLPTAHHGIVKSISFSRDGRTLASIGRQTDSAVYLLDAATGAVLKRFQPHELCGSFVRLSPDGRYLASTSDDASVYIWDLQNPLQERTFFTK